MTKSRRRRRWRRKSKTNLDGDPRRRDPPLIHNHYDLKMRSVGYRFSWWCEGGPLSYDRKKFWGVSGSLYQIFIVVRLNESIMKTLMGIFLISVILVQTKQGMCNRVFKNLIYFPQRMNYKFHQKIKIWPANK